MTEHRQRENGSASDRKWWHDQRVLATALISTAPFIASLAYQVVALSSEWGEVKGRVANIEVSLADRPKMVERFISVESRMAGLDGAIVRIEAALGRLDDKLDRLVERDRSPPGAP